MKRIAIIGAGAVGRIGGVAFHGLDQHLVEHPVVVDLPIMGLNECAIMEVKMEAIFTNLKKESVPRFDLTLLPSVIPRNRAERRSLERKNKRKR